MVERNGDRLVNRAGIEPALHGHETDAGFGVAVQDALGDRRGAPIARQQRGVDVDTPLRRQREKRCAQNLTE